MSATCVICSAKTFVSPGYNGTAVKCRMCMHTTQNTRANVMTKEKTPEEELADMAAWGAGVIMAHESSERETDLEMTLTPNKLCGPLVKEMPQLQLQQPAAAKASSSKRTIAHIVQPRFHW